MELITNILIEYLKHNKRIVVPKLGTFIVKQPLGVIRFTDLIRTDDGVLRSLIMAYGVNVIEADVMIDRYVFEIHHSINQSGVYAIDNFGEFLRGENNNTIFRHIQEPKVIGGKIKPPVERFEEEKQRMLRMLGREENSAPKEPSERREPPRAKRKKSNNESGSIVKPDSYLRGLKYDKNSGKRRGDDGKTNRRGKGKGIAAMILILLLLVIGICWYIWSGRVDIFANDSHSNSHSRDISTTTIVRDTSVANSVDSMVMEQRDSLLDATNEKKQEIISSKNSYLNP